MTFFLFLTFIHSGHYEIRVAGGDRGQLHYGGWRGGIALSRAGGSADNQDICRPTLSNYGCGPQPLSVSLTLGPGQFG